MSDVVSRLLKINIRARSKENALALLCDGLGGNVVSDRGGNTIGEFQGCVVDVAGVMIDVVVPDGPDTALGRVIEKYGEGVDSICFAVDDMEHTQSHLKNHGIEFSRSTEFQGNKVGFVHPRNAQGLGLEFIQDTITDSG